MKIKVRCDCGKTLVASDELAGKKTKCPACGAVIRLPRLDEVSEHPTDALVTETGLNVITDSQAAYVFTSGLRCTCRRVAASVPLHVGRTHAQYFARGRIVFRGFRLRYAGERASSNSEIATNLHARSV